MNRIWANRLEARTQVWADVPHSRKVAIDTILHQDVVAESLTEERYNEITGNPF